MIIIYHYDITWYKIGYQTNVNLWDLWPHGIAENWRCGSGITGRTMARCCWWHGLPTTSTEPWMISEIVKSSGFVWKWLVPHCTQWFSWSLSLLNGYFIGNIPYFQTNPSDISWYYCSCTFHHLSVFCVGHCWTLVLMDKNVLAQSRCSTGPPTPCEDTGHWQCAWGDAGNSLRNSFHHGGFGSVRFGFGF